MQVKLSSEAAFRYLEMVSQAAAANPFSSERDDLDRKIINEWLPKEASEKLEFEKIANFSKLVLKDLMANKKDFSDFSPKQILILQDAALFVVFHKYITEFDRYIEAQNNAPGAVLELSFANDIIYDLEHYGFRKLAAHYIAIFFQMRRAFYFISNYVTGVSAPVRELREKLWRTIFTSDSRQYISVLFDKMESYSVLLLGETGVGKGQSAAALGRSAYIPFDLKTKKFVANFLDVFISANISEYPQTLVESELFGHKKGSFTGALEHHSGLFGQTHANGVLFLDEIGELEIPLQVKILRVLQDRFYSPVGSHEKKRFSGRLIAATNANVNEKVEQGLFRSDLYHRLASDIIQIPSLRERFADEQKEKRLLVSRIVSRLLGQADSNQEQRIAEIIDLKVAKNYQWPGNLREFEQVIRRIVLHGESWEYVPLELPSLGQQFNSSFSQEGLPNWRFLQCTADELMVHYARSAYQELGSYEKVAQKLNVDWRTAKRWIAASSSLNNPS